MSRSDAEANAEVDWRGWILAAWIVVFGSIYAVMMIRERAPWLFARISGRG
jgi:hypothetical protein